MAALFVLILVQQVLQKKGGQEQQALGRSKGGFTTKIHAVVDALGNPLEFVITAGQAHEMSQALILVSAFPQAKNVIADKGYDCNHLAQTLHEQGSVPIIPSRSNAKSPRHFDKDLYKERYLVECLFNKMKYFRRIFSRFDKLAKRYISFLHFAATLLWLK